MLTIKNLNKFYGKKKVLKDINLNIKENKIYGLLGRNGVGKTTLLNIISNRIDKDSGEVKLNGEEIFENSKALEEISLINEKGFGIDIIKIKRIFDTAKTLYKDWDEGYKNYLVKEFKINPEEYYDDLSRGNQTIIGLIIGLASRSKLTIFDEPTLGVDAVYRYKFYNLLLEDMANNPRTIIISTHFIDEVTNLFEEIIILKDGEVLIKEEVSSFMEKAYALNGKLENMTSIIKDKRIIHREEFGMSSIVSLLDDLTKEEKIKLKQNNIEISQIPLQKLFIYLTENDYIEGVI